MNDTQFEKLYKELNDIFPNSPFSICCINNIKELDKVFTRKKTIIIKDDRASKSNYYYSNLNNNELGKYIDYLVVKQKENNPITLRQIITEMSNSSHYNNNIIMGDFHIFLEGFKKTTDIQYVANFGS
jgi:hypothetical protein